MPEPNQDWRIPLSPADVPGLICFWDFQDEGPRKACAGRPYILEEVRGPVRRIPVVDAPFGRWAAKIEEGSWLCSSFADCPDLDRRGPAGHLTMIAWIMRGRTEERHCEFIAGKWNETGRSRQYGLFLNISTWGGEDQVCGHVSQSGGPTPGYLYCMDGAIGATKVPWDSWKAVGMTYDGVQVMAWLDGVLDRQEGINPYHFAGGLHGDGKSGSDFTVGAVDRSREMGNFFCGIIGGLAVYDRALSPAVMHALCRPKL